MKVSFGIIAGLLSTDDAPTPPASARNILFNHFYDTGNDGAIFADSDTVLNLHHFPHTHVNICDILRTSRENWDITLFSPHNIKDGINGLSMTIS